MELQTYESITRIHGLDTGPRRRGRVGLAQAICALAALVNVRVVGPLGHEINVRRSVRQLDALDDRMLNDLGLKRWDIEQAVRDNMRTGGMRPRRGSKQDETHLREMDVWTARDGWFWLTTVVNSALSVILVREP